ncbi:hypothetical protein DVA76_18955, partial [Acinetobacter baumannii]
LILRVCIHSDGSELLSLIVHNHTVSQSKSYQVIKQNLLSVLILCCSLSLFQKMAEKEALLIFYNHTAEAKLQAIM